MAIKVLITGAAGQIAYSLIFMVARGHMFGANEKIILHLLDIEKMMQALQAIEMELEDCCFELLEKVVITSDVSVAFEDIDVALMVGAMPRLQGMERSDLLKANVKIFDTQGKALDAHAKKTVKVLVVGNPANTNALIMSRSAPSIPKENFSALTRLDHNRAIGHLADLCKASCRDVRNVIIWGNHSATQYPDVTKAVVNLPSGEVPCTEKIKNDAYLKNEFITKIQQRGAEVIKMRKASSAASAAKAIVDHMHSWWIGTKPGEHVSMAVMSNGEYGAPKDVMFSFPVQISNKKWEIVKGLAIDDFSKGKIEITSDELVKERDDALQFLASS